MYWFHWFCYNTTKWGPFHTGGHTASRICYSVMSDWLDVRLVRFLHVLFHWFCYNTTKWGPFHTGGHKASCIFYNDFRSVGCFKPIGEITFEGLMSISDGSRA
jgi:hypothetical protein